MTGATEAMAGKQEDAAAGRGPHLGTGAVMSDHPGGMKQRTGGAPATSGSSPATSGCSERAEYGTRGRAVADGADSWAPANKEDVAVTAANQFLNCSQSRPRTTGTSKPPSLFHTSVNWFLARKLQKEVETQDPSKGIDGRVAARDPGPTPQQPAGDPTLPQFSAWELLPPHSVQRPCYPPQVPSPSLGPVEGVMLV
ncbi:UNVERIFIED_CONTAM: hypothetical protein FKN15_012422 [Acipenser sinensis]